MNPIVGPRFKCTVRKNFDYCANCEATKTSPHAFLKIDTPAQAPRAMFTIIDENTPGEADIDINLDSMGQAFQQFGQHFGGMGGMGGRGGRCGPWGRRGHGMRGPGGPCGPRGMNQEGTPGQGHGPYGMGGKRWGGCGKKWGQEGEKQEGTTEG